MIGFPIPLPITGKYATFNEKYAKAVRNRRCWVCSDAPTQKGVSKASPREGLKGVYMYSKRPS